MAVAVGTGEVETKDCSVVRMLMYLILIYHSFAFLLLK